MSIILDALKKSERERSLGAVPTIDHLVNPAAPEPTASTSKLKILGPLALVVLLFGGILGGYWGFTQTTEKVAKLAALAPEQVVAANHSTVAAPPKTSAPPPAQKVATPIPAPPPKPRPIPAKKIIPVPPKAEIPVSNPPIARAPVATPSQVVVAAAAEDYIPYLHEMPLSLQRRLRGLQLTVHVFSSNPEQCFVYLNGTKHKAGDTVEEKFLLEKVTREGVILSERDKKFRISAR